MAEDNILFYVFLFALFVTCRYMVKCWRNASWGTLLTMFFVCFPFSILFYLGLRLYHWGFSFNLKLPGWLKRKPKVDESTMAGKAMGKGIQLSAHGDRGNLFRF